MWGSLFGRGKDDATEPSCAACGRTLLAGEWTQRVVDGAGEDRLVCSLCAQVGQAADGEPSAAAGAPVGAVKPSAPRTDSDTFWKALKDKDAEIARLRSQVTQIEAARRELAARLAEYEAEGQATPAASPNAPPEAAAAPEDSGAEDASVGAPAFDDSEPAPEATAEPAPEAAAEPAPEAAPEPELGSTQSSLTLLQRGVDLLNVSTVPKKIAETNEHLGIPSVHVGLEDQALLATFLWSMGWYTYSVSMDGTGTIRLSDRGYQQRTDLQPNASVRSDGTVQLAPARIARAAAPAASERPQQAASEQSPAAPATPAPEIVSKSLMGQRTDDEVISWEQTKARDFDWDR